MSENYTRVDEFRLKLEKLNADFICNTPLPGQSVSVTFLGPFQGQLVLWIMTLEALKSHQRSEDAVSFIKTNGNPVNPYIEISVSGSGVYCLKVGLDIEIIDEPAIRKALIMMRNYKRLDMGRIEFGGMHS